MQWGYTGIGNTKISVYKRYNWKRTETDPRHALMSKAPALWHSQSSRKLRLYLVYILLLLLAKSAMAKTITTRLKLLFQIKWVFKLVFACLCTKVSPMFFTIYKSPNSKPYNWWHIKGVVPFVSSLLAMMHYIMINCTTTQKHYGTVNKKALIWKTNSHCCSVILYTALNSASNIPLPTEQISVTKIFFSFLLPWILLISQVLLHTKNFLNNK